MWKEVQGWRQLGRETRPVYEPQLREDLRDPGYAGRPNPRGNPLGRRSSACRAGYCTTIGRGGWFGRVWAGVAVTFGRPAGRRRARGAPGVTRAAPWSGPDTQTGGQTPAGLEEAGPDCRCRGRGPAVDDRSDRRLDEHGRRRGRDVGPGQRGAAGMGRLGRPQRCQGARLPPRREAAGKRVLQNDREDREVGDEQHAQGAVGVGRVGRVQGQRLGNPLRDDRGQGADRGREDTGEYGAVAGGEPDRQCPRSGQRRRDGPEELRAADPRRV